MVKHLPVVSLVLAAFSALQLAIAVLLGGIFALAGGGMGLAGAAGGEEELLVFGALYGFVGLFVAVFSGVMCVPGFLAAWGIYTRRPWARLVGMVVAAIVCLNFPLGTMLGIYALFVLLDPEVGAEFAAPRMG